ncbi:MAG: DUF456 domain-containing protein [Akkermansiaceae bacterium]
MAGPGNRSDDSVVWDWIIEMTLTWGVWIATGSLVGLFFMPFGLLLGPLIGAAGCEWLFAKKTATPATVSGVGSVIGTVAGLVLKMVVALLMVVVFAIDLFWL